MFNIWTMQTLKDEDVEDLLVCALEGGSNYWYVIEEVLPAPHIIVDGGELDVYTAIMRGNGVRVGLLEEDGPINGATTWTLDRRTVETGLSALSTNHPTTFARVCTGDYDSADADVFLQLALFGEVVFG